jgi:predicted PurR-regulated permease PerM
VLLDRPPVRDPARLGAAAIAAPRRRWIERATGGRRKLAVVILMLLALGVVLVPTALLSKSLLDGAQSVASHVEGDRLVVPPAPDRVAQWPLVGPKVHEIWNLASTSLESVLARFRPQVRAFGAWLLTLAKQVAMAVLMTVVALIIAALPDAREEANHRRRRGHGLPVRTVQQRSGSPGRRSNRS